MEKGEELRLAVQDHPFVFENHEIRCTISGGVFHPDMMNAFDVQGVLKLSDNALYEAKRSGRNKMIAAIHKEVDLTKPISLSKTRMKFYQAPWERTEFIDHDISTLIGYPYEQLASGELSLRDILHPDDHDVFMKLDQKESFITILRVIGMNGKIKILRGEFTPIQEDEWLIEVQDVITLAQTIEDKMIADNFEAVMRYTDDLIYFKDRYHIFTAGSQALVRLTNVSTKEEIIGKTDYDLFPREFADQYFALEKKVFNGDVEVAEKIQPIRDKEGNAGWIESRQYPIKNDQGEIIGLFGIARVVSEIIPS
jgi:PAS domain S-box-containing protein